MDGVRSRRPSRLGAPVRDPPRRESPARATRRGRPVVRRPARRSHRLAILDGTPSEGPVLPTLLDWFTEGIGALESAFHGAAHDERVWSWAEDQTAGFWLRTQAIEAAVHRWDIENAVTAAQPIDAALAADAIRHNFEVMVPKRRHDAPSEPGRGERYRFRATDREEAWTVRFDPGGVAFTDGHADVELAATTSDLMLFLWHRIPADRLTATGDQAVLDRYFALVPPA